MHPPFYEQQVEAICRSIRGISEQTRLFPEAVAPDASSQPSGAAVCCQLHGLPVPATQSQASPTACAPLPELAQQASGVHDAAVEAHVLPVPAQQSAAELAAAVATAGDANSLAPPGSRQLQPSSWMHLDLQQYLHELEPSQWVGAASTVATAAASATTCRTAVQGRSLQQQQHDASGGLASPAAADVQQPPPAAAAVLAWMAGVHAAAADSSQQGRRACSRQEQPHWCLAPPTAAVHPNIQPVLHVAPAATANSSSSSTESVCVLVEHIPTDAVSLLRHSPAVLGGDWHLRCLLHQLLHALADLHARGFAMGGFSLDQVRLICPGWVQMLMKPSGLLLPQAKGSQHMQRQQQQQQLQGGVTSGQGQAAVGQPQQQQQQLLPQPADQQQQQQQGRWSQGTLLVSEPHYTLPQLTEMWRQRVISNFEYLLWVNAAAGRRWGDRKRHPFVPWVLDFSRRPDLGPTGSASGTNSGSTGPPPPGWRDLGVSQYRRIKGDAQLDQTYAMSAAAAAAAGAGPNGPWSGRVAGAPGAASSAALTLSPWSWEAWDGSSSSAAAAATGSGGFGFSVLGGMAAQGPGVSGAAGVGRAGAAAAAAVQPHHISNEPMSELSYAIYMARRLPVELLVQLVRRSFRPEEYPSSLEGLYHSSPDEALPQFYADPAAFESTHASMRDLAAPGWAADAHDFVRLHRAALESDYVSANLHKWIDLNFGVALSGPVGLAAKNIHLGSTDSSSSSSVKLLAATTAAAGLVVPGVEPCTWGVFQLFQQHHPARNTQDSSSSTSSGSRSLQASVVEQHHHQQQQQIDGPSAPRPDSATSSTSGTSSSDGQLPGLQDCWIELTSLEAAAAAGCWQSGKDPASKQQQQQQGSHLQQGLPPIRSASYLSSSSSRDDRPAAVLLPAEAAAADLAALGQVALQLYTRQQQQIALGSSSGLHAAQQCWHYCITSTNKETSSTGQRSSSLTRRRSSGRNSSRGLAGGGSSSSNSNRPGLTGSRQTGAGLQSGSRQQCVPPAVSLFVQQCGSGNFSAAQLLQVSTFLPPWLEHARRFMLQLLFEHRHHPQQQQQQQPKPQQQQQQQAVEDGPTRDLQQATEDGSSSSSSRRAAGYQLVCDPFVRLSELAEPGGALDSLAPVPEALQVCLPAVLHIVRGALLHGSPARTINHQREQQQQQEQALLLLDAACLVVFRLTMVLSECQLQQHLVPLLVAMLIAEAGETQNNAAHPSSALSAVAATAGSPQQHTGSTEQDASPAAATAAAAAVAGITEAAQAQQQQQQQGSTGQGLSAALRVAVCRRAVLQPALWSVLLQKLGQQQLLGMLLPPLLAASLESHPDVLCACLAAAAAAGRGERTGTSSRQQPVLPPDQAQLQQQCVSQAELAARCLAVLAEGLPFPVVAQHILRPLMMALPAGLPPAPSNNSAAKASTASPSPLLATGFTHPGDTPRAATASAEPQHPLVPTASAAAGGGSAVWPAFRAACGLLAVAQVLPSKLVEEFIFRPLLAMSLLPAAHAAGVSVAAGGGRGGSSGSSLGGGGTNTGRLALAALPVLEGLLLSLLPLCKAECMLPSLLPAAAAAAPPAATSQPTWPSPTGGGPVATMALGGASAFSTLASSGPSSTGSGTSSLASSGAGEAAAAGVSQSAAASLSRNSSLQQPSYAAAVTANKAAAAAVPFWRLAELLLIGPDVQAVAVCPLLYPRLAALLLVGLEGYVLQAAASSTAGSGGIGSSSSVDGVLAGSNSNSNSSSMSSGPATAVVGVGGAAAAGAAFSDAGTSAAREQLLSLYSGWVVPCVLQPLLSQQGTAAWGVLLQSQQQKQQQQQQQQQEGLRRAYWRAVLLLYAAAVHQLGLGAVRASLPDWHSVEVWLLAETGWEPGQTSPPAAAAAQGTPSPTLQLLTAMAWQGSSSGTQGSVSTSGSGSSSSEAEVLQQVGLLVTLPRLGSASAAGSDSSSGSSSSNIRAGASLTPARQQGGVHDLLAPGSSSSSSSSQIAGRVTHLLQRIAEDKVARRSLNTTHEFLEGVGWSLPRPTTPAAAAAAAAGGGSVAGNGAATPAFAADSSALPPFMRQQQLQQQQQGSYSGAAGRKGTYSSADGGGLRSRPLSATTPSSSSNSSQVQSDAEAMHRAASAPAPAGVVRRSTVPPAAAAAAAAVGGAALTAAEATAAAACLNAGLSHHQQQQQQQEEEPPAAAPSSSTGAAVAAAAATAGAGEQLKGRRVARGGSSSSSAVAGGAHAVVGHSWAAELSQLRTLLETPTRTSAGERGPSAGKEWFWLRNNPKLTPFHLLPDFSHNPAAAAPSSSSSSGSSGSPASFGTWATAGCSRPWTVPGGVWWEEGWRLGAVCLHSWPAHKERLRALAVDPWERLLVTAGRGGAREPGSSSASSWVVRVWELADAEAKVQYAAHTAAVHQVAFMGPCSPAVASLDVSGALHVWSRATGAQLQAFVPLDPAEQGPAAFPPVARLSPVAPRQAAAVGAQAFGVGDGRLGAAAGGVTAAGGAGGAAGAAAARQGKEQHAAAVPGNAPAAAADSRRASVGMTTAAGGGAVAEQQLSGYTGSSGPTGAVGGLTVPAASGGYWERGCSSGRGWQALAAVPAASGGAASGGFGSSASPGPAGAAGGVLDAAGAAAGAAAALGGPGWPLAGGHLGYTCMVPVDSSHAVVESLLLSGSSGSAGDGCYGSSGGSNAGVLLAGTADGHVCMLDVETGALLEDAVACWDSRSWLYGSSQLSGHPRSQQAQAQVQHSQQQQQQQAQANSLLGPAAAGGAGVLGPAGWDGLSTAGDPSSCVLSAVCCSSRGMGGGGGLGAAGAWVGAGSGGGRVTLLDMRSGCMVATWQAHGARVSQLQALAGAQGDHMLLSCSADRTMKLWDLRMVPQAAAPHAGLGGGRFGGSSGGSGLAAPLMTYRSGRDGIEGFVVYQDAAIVYGGAGIGLAPLEVPLQAGGVGPGQWGVQLQHQQQQGSNVQLVRMTAVRGRGHRGAGVRDGLGAAGAGAVVGLGLLPHSKLLVVGTEDGLLRICR